MRRIGATQCRAEARFFVQYIHGGDTVFPPSVATALTVNTQNRFSVLTFVSFSLLPLAL